MNTNTQDREWTPHNAGDECPVPAGTMIDVMDADGFVWVNVEALANDGNGDAAAAQFWRESPWRSLMITHWRMAA